MSGIRPREAAKKRFPRSRFRQRARAPARATRPHSTPSSYLGRQHGRVVVVTRLERGPRDGGHGGERNGCRSLGRSAGRERHDRQEQGGADEVAAHCECVCACARTETDPRRGPERKSETAGGFAPLALHFSFRSLLRGRGPGARAACWSHPLAQASPTSHATAWAHSLPRLAPSPSRDTHTRANRKTKNANGRPRLSLSLLLPPPPRHAPCGIRARDGRGHRCVGCA